MKWIYLPIMFALAFLYTKMSYTDILPKKVAAVLPGRRPASVEEVKNLKPFRHRIQPEKFYKILENEGVSAFASVTPFKGVVISDVHVENFGFVIDDNKKSHYSILDFSEASKGKIFQDVLGHLISAKALDRRTTWLEYFEFYKKGLQGSSHAFSFYVEKGIGSAITDADQYLDANMTHDYPIEFTEIKKDHAPIGAIEKELIEKELKKNFPRIEIFQALSKNDGGKNYQILARINPTGRVQWILLKELTIADHDKISGSSLTAIKRLENIKSNLYDNALENSLSLIKIGKNDFTLQLVESFSAQLNFDEIPFEDYHDIVLDQAYVLGRIHARSIKDQIEDYIKAWAKIPAATVDEKAIELKYKLKDLNE